ncbi:hypothetical protein TCON_1733 [Astathelohania contejeani]|uniref:Uncharacterized protein n=1 Tax=Astathelohania contejeani TaxID=164912 RepID=A0ABQ7HY02_9MICR|nr:hypothetical protein TCON_1733 [Thelohania contejeani]
MKMKKEHLNKNGKRLSAKEIKDKKVIAQNSKDVKSVKEKRNKKKYKGEEGIKKEKECRISNDRNFSSISNNTTKSKSILKPKPKKKIKSLTKLTPLEREIITRGSHKDRINLLSLKIIENNSIETFHELIDLCKNQRHEIIYYILRNIKNILLEFKMTDIKLKRRVVLLFQTNINNEFIQHCVITLVYELLKKDVLFLELIYCFVNKIGSRKSCELVLAKLRKLVIKGNRVDNILYAIEDFFFKNDGFKNRIKILKFLNSIKTDKDLIKEFFSKIVSTGVSYNSDPLFKEYLTVLVDGLNKLDMADESVNKLIYRTLSTPKIIYTGIEALFNSNDPGLGTTILKALGTVTLSENRKYIQPFINITYNYLMEEKDETLKYKIINNMLSSGMFYDTEFIISSLIMCQQIIKDSRSVYSVYIYLNHYDSVVRYLSNSILHGKSVEPFNPFDNENYRNMERISNNSNV